MAKIWPKQRTWPKLVNRIEFNIEKDKCTISCKMLLNRIWWLIMLIMNLFWSILVSCGALYERWKELGRILKRITITWWSRLPQWYHGHAKDPPLPFTHLVFILLCAASLDVLHNASLRITRTIPEMMIQQNWVISNLTLLLGPSSHSTWWISKL